MFCDCDDELRERLGYNPEDLSTIWICQGCGCTWEEE